MEVLTDEMRRRKWNESKKQELKLRMSKLALKLVRVTAEIQDFGPKLIRRGYGTYYGQRTGMIRNWHKMSKQSLFSTRKKLDRLNKELHSL